MNANEDMIAYSRYKQIGDENLYLMEKVRQQQAEITNKKLVNDTFADLIKLQGKKIDEQQAEIEALNQRIERMIENQSHHEGIAHAGGFEAGWQSAQAKTLTDEEIHNLFLSFCNVGFTQVDEIGFARAILRKAQQK